MKYIFTALLFLSFAFSFGQDTTAPKEDAKVVIGYVAYVNSKTVSSNDVIIYAQPFGGMNGFRRHITSSFNLPEVSEKTIAKVVAEFVVSEDGSIKDVKILEETPSNLGLGKEAIKVLTNSRKWIPGIMNGKIVNQLYNLPMSFEIPVTEKKGQPIEEVKKEEAPIVTEDNITSSEKQAEPIGGITKFYTDLSAKIQVPEVEVAGNYKTKVKFVVNQDGSLSDFQVLEETPSKVGLGLNVIKYLQTIENWIPSEQNGKKVKMYFVLPVTLNIEPESVIKKKD